MKIDEIINSNDPNNAMIELDNIICELCDYGDRIDILNEHQRIFFYIQNLEREVNNGGFNQFYLNSSGDFAHETVESLERIGAYKTAEIVKQANSQFPNKHVPKDQDERLEILEEIEDLASEVWEDLDKQFFIYQDNLNKLNLEFIKKNKDAFKF